MANGNNWDPKYDGPQTINIVKEQKYEQTPRTSRVFSVFGQVDSPAISKGAQAELLKGKAQYGQYKMQRNALWTLVGIGVLSWLFLWGPTAGVALSFIKTSNPIVLFIIIFVAIYFWRRYL
jgi:hypothetical protein